MFGLTLKPRGGADEEFFAIHDELVIVQPTTFGTTTQFLRQSIVPVVAHVQGEDLLRCLGTGFFISCSGLLVTAAHVVTDPIERCYGGLREHDDMTWRGEDLKLGILLPTHTPQGNPGFAFRPMEWASFLARRSGNPLPIATLDLKLTSDTALCKVSPIAPDVPYQPLAIVQSGLVGVGMGIGKRAVAVGYGAMQDVILSRDTNGDLAGDFAFDLHASTGNIVERFPDNLVKREASAPGACFAASLRLPAGMSGSPIFDHEGVYVHGVVSMGLVAADGVAPLGYGSMLDHSWHVPIRAMENKTLGELHSELEHGFAKLSGPGM